MTQTGALEAPAGGCGSQLSRRLSVGECVHTCWGVCLVWSQGYTGFSTVSLFVREGAERAGVVPPLVSNIDRSIIVCILRRAPCFIGLVRWHSLRDVACFSLSSRHRALFSLLRLNGTSGSPAPPFCGTHQHHLSCAYPPATSDGGGGPPWGPTHQRRRRRWRNPMPPPTRRSPRRPWPHPPSPPPPHASTSGTNGDVGVSTSRGCFPTPHRVQKAARPVRAGVLKSPAEGCSPPAVAASRVRASTRAWEEGLLRLVTGRHTWFFPRTSAREEDDCAGFAGKRSASSRKVIRERARASQSNR